MRIGTIAAIGALLAASPVGAAVWPGNAPCDGTLQACIDNVPAGSTVEIAGIADESIQIQKSLTLTSAPGQDGTIGGGSTQRSLGIGEAGSGPVTVLVEDLTLDHTDVYIDLDDGAGDEVTFRDCLLTLEPGAIGGSILLYASVDSTVRFENNRIESDGNGAIQINPEGGSPLVEFYGNTLTSFTSYVLNDGVGVSVSNDASPTVRVQSNLIYGLGDASPRGIEVDLLDQAAGVVSLNNNTIVDFGGTSSSGISVDRLSANAGTGIFLLNNIVTDATTHPFLLPFDAGNVTIQNNHNTFHDNDVSPRYGAYSQGGSTTFEDPQFRDPGSDDYRLAAASPMIDSGIDFIAPAPDAAGNLRTDAAPDRGAFEYVPEPGAGAAAAAALGTLAALRGRRRQRGRASGSARP